MLRSQLLRAPSLLPAIRFSARRDWPKLGDICREEHRWLGRGWAIADLPEHCITCGNTSSSRVTMRAVVIQHVVETHGGRVAAASTKRNLKHGNYGSPRLPASTEDCPHLTCIACCRRRPLDHAGAVERGRRWPGALRSRFCA